MIHGLIFGGDANERTAIAAIVEAAAFTTDRSDDFREAHIQLGQKRLD
ncbi:hypothetical protein [uncultured Nevskia sp.]|nr:hypothetical protein [uncultured Nevskia sp.]